MTPEEKRQHEYTLMEFRLLIEDLKESGRATMAQFCKDVIKPLQDDVSDIKDDVTVLKTSYGFIYGGIALLGSGLAYIFYWIFGHVQQAHIIAKQSVHIIKHIRMS